jgi:hypothetical protein
LLSLIVLDINTLIRATKKGKIDDRSLKKVQSTKTQIPPRMAYSSDDSGSDEYRPDASDTESDSETEAGRLHRRAHAASSPSLADDAQRDAFQPERGRKILTRSSTKRCRNGAPAILCGASQMKAMGCGSTSRGATVKSRTPTGRSHRKQSSSASDSDLPTVPVIKRKQAINKEPKLKEMQIPVKHSTERDPLFQARARGVELLADLHNIKYWLETAGYLGGIVTYHYHRMQSANDMLGAPAYIRDALDQNQL